MSEVSVPLRPHDSESGSDGDGGLIGTAASPLSPPLQRRTQHSRRTAQLLRFVASLSDSDRVVLHSMMRRKDINWGRIRALSLTKDDGDSGQAEAGAHSSGPRVTGAFPGFDATGFGDVNDGAGDPVDARAAVDPRDLAHLGDLDLYASRLMGTSSDLDPHNVLLPELPPAASCGTPAGAHQGNALEGPSDTPACHAPPAHYRRSYRHMRKTERLRLQRDAINAVRLFGKSKTEELLADALALLRRDRGHTVTWQSARTPYTGQARGTWGQTADEEEVEDGASFGLSVHGDGQVVVRVLDCKCASQRHTHATEAEST